MSSNYLQINFPGDDSQDNLEINEYEHRNKPFADSEVFLAPIEEVRILSQGNDVKKVYDLKISTKNISYKFLPGDTIGVLPCNNEQEVHALLTRLSIQKVADKICELNVAENTNKKNPKVPKHIPRVCTLRNIFLKYIDIRNPPKKLFLKSLSAFTKNEEDVAKLSLLCAPNSSKEYTDFICGSGRTMLGLLMAFPSCLPPVELILEHSSPLQPRPYSISSTPLLDCSIHITFFIANFEDDQKGVCTGWMEEQIHKNSIGWNLPFYFRKPSGFRFPENDAQSPMILIASGTGLAPFQGFLQHRSMMLKNSQENLGSAILFYGCRYSNRDFLYRNEIKEYLTSGALTKLYEAFSRETPDVKVYVQDKLKENGKELYDYVANLNARIFICGDAKTMMKNVKSTILEVVVEFGHLREDVAAITLDKLEKDRRFVTDVWT